MIEELKRALYAGLGATAVTYEKVEAVFNELVEKGKLSAEDARNAAAKVIDDSKSEFERSESAVKDLFESLLDKAAVAKKKDLDALRCRVESLEAQLQSCDCQKP